MNQYEECINNMWEEVEGKHHASTPKKPTEEERWKRFKEEYAGRSMLVISEWGLIDCSLEAVKDIAGGEHLSFEEYLEIMRVSGQECRSYFERCYYEAFDCSFRGKIEKKNRNKVCFEKIYVNGFLCDGDGFSGKEDHVWMDLKGFESYEIGECVSFSAEVYRYLKTGNGKRIDFGLRNPEWIKKIGDYELPSDDDLLMQSIDDLICEVCLFREHCYMGMCIANEEWRENMRKMLFEAAKSKK